MARLLSVLGAQSTYAAYCLLALALFDDPFRAGLVTAASYGSTRLRCGVERCAAGPGPAAPTVGGVVGQRGSRCDPVHGRTGGRWGTDRCRDLGAVRVRGAHLRHVGGLLTRISTSLRVPEEDRTAPGRARRDEVLAGFHVVRSDTVLLRSIVFLSGMGFVLTASFFTVMELFNSRGSTLQAGVVIAIQGAGLLAGSAIAPVLGDRLRPLTAFAIQGALWTLGLAVIAWSPTLLVTGPALAGMWAAVPTGRVSLQSYIADEVPIGLRGRLHSVRFVTSALTTPLGPLAAGAVLSSWSSSTGLWGLAALSLIVTASSTVDRRQATGR